MRLVGFKNCYSVRTIHLAVGLMPKSGGTVVIHLSAMKTIGFMPEKLNRLIGVV
jgi:hypothetical protein